MANAKKCDRCGKFFDPNDVPAMIAHFGNPVLQTAEDYSKNKVTTYLKKRSTIFENVDLCPECTGDFTLFMDGTPLALHENDFDKPDISEESVKSTDEEDKEYQKTAFQKFLDKVDRLGNEFFNELDS